MKRKAILVGDPPSSGGAVLTNGCKFTINGISTALMNGAVWCEACKTSGTFAKAGGPYRPTYHGVEGVLEGDLVICKCAVPPTLLAQAVSSGLPEFFVDDMVDFLGVVQPPHRQFFNMGNTPHRLKGLAHTLQFELKNRQTGKLRPNIPYRILLKNNTEYIGLTDALGLTEMIESDIPFSATLEAPYHDEDNVTLEIQCSCYACIC